MSLPGGVAPSRRSAPRVEWGEERSEAASGQLAFDIPAAPNRSPLGEWCHKCGAPPRRAVQNDLW